MLTPEQFYARLTYSVDTLDSFLTRHAEDLSLVDRVRLHGIRSALGGCLNTTRDYIFGDDSDPDLGRPATPEEDTAIADLI